MSDDRPSYEELVERLIASEREVRLMRGLLKDVAEQEDTTVSFLVAQAARIAQLEANVEKLAKKRGAK